MKKLILAALLATPCAGCSTIIGTADLPEGGKVRLTVLRLAWKTDRVHFERVTTNGHKVTVTIEKTGSDPVTAKAVAEGVAAGLVKGAKGGVP